MEAKLLKKNIPEVMRNNIPNKLLDGFLKVNLNALFIKNEEHYIIVEINDNNLKQESYNGKVWFIALNGRFGVFNDESSRYDSFKEKGWRILFQNRKV